MALPPEAKICEFLRPLVATELLTQAMISFDLH